MQILVVIGRAKVYDIQIVCRFTNGNSSGSVMINSTTCGYDIRYKVVRIRGANVFINSTAWVCNV